MERSHLVRMHIKNIGCIGNDGLTVELDDIVCLVGANNAGKTTVLRAYELAV
ncbi:AAA family ATPase, partial [Neisseria elongata]|nr:AAA family ATPase [Neisseria elongata subsp. nitroreducens]